jgi:hypothetical protein
MGARMSGPHLEHTTVPCPTTRNPETAMSPRRRLANLALLAALATLTAACSPEDIAAYATSQYVAPKVRDVVVVQRDSSGVVGLVQIQYDTTPALLSASFHFPGIGRTDVGARYPMHIHAGRDCSVVDVPIAHDLGAPASSIQPGDLNIPSARIDPTPLPILHLVSGYYLDVHAPNSPTGLPLACAVFP